MKAAPTHTVIETGAFSAKARKLGVTPGELAEIYDIYATDPAYGKIERETGGLRKGRVGKDSSGKSGGYRVFSFFGDERDPVFLLWMLDKTEDDSLTKVQKNAFRKLIGELKKELRR